MGIREYISWLRSDLSSNFKHRVWRFRATCSLISNEKVKFHTWQRSRNGIIATIQYGDKVFAVLDVSNPDKIERYRSIFDRLIIHRDDSEESGYAVGEPEKVPIINEIELKRQTSARGVAISTLVFNDSELIDQWIAHHRKIGVNHFLVYFNSQFVPKRLLDLGSKNDDVTVIAWPVRYAYWSRHKGRSTFHIAQPAQITHSFLLSRAYNICEYLIVCDLDEYILCEDVYELANKMKGEFGFVNCWSRGCAGFSVGDFSFCSEFDFSAHERRKICRNVGFDGHWKIHGSAQVQNTQDAVMLHFANLAEELGKSKFAQVGFPVKLTKLEDSDEWSIVRRYWNKLYRDFI